MPEVSLGGLLIVFPVVLNCSIPIKLGLNCPCTFALFFPFLLFLGLVSNFKSKGGTLGVTGGLSNSPLKDVFNSVKDVNFKADLLISVVSVKLINSNLFIEAKPVKDVCACANLWDVKLIGCVTDKEPVSSLCFKPKILDVFVCCDILLLINGLCRFTFRDFNNSVFITYPSRCLCCFYIYYSSFSYDIRTNI